MKDIAGDDAALARAAGIVDLDALERAREKVRAVADAEQALRLAVAERNQAVREAAAANPLAWGAALARELGVSPSVVTTALRAVAAPPREASEHLTKGHPWASTT